MNEPTGLKISNIDFSFDESDVLKFGIEHDDHSPEYMWLTVHRKSEDDPNLNLDATFTISASQMKSLGKALVFAGEYVENLYSIDGHNF